METTSPAGWGASQPHKNLPTGEGEVPLAPPVGGPPTPKVEVRTMGSDLRSVQEQGGGEPRPYIPRPAPPSPPPRSPSPPGGPVAGGGSPTPFSKPQVPFTPPRVESSVSPPPTGMPPRPSMTGTPATLIGTYKPKSKRGIFLGVLSFLVVVGLAAVGYFFIYPMFAVTPGAPEVVVTPPTPPEPTPPAPEAPPVTEPIPPAPTPPPETIAGIDAHTSLFSVPADIKADVTVTPIEIEALRAALPANPVSVPLLKEVVIKTEEGKVVAFGAFASRLVPGFFTAELAASFADDATYFTYSNGDGTWFGLAVQLKNGANLGALQEKMSAFQHDPDNDNFFLANPGAQGVWRDGTIKGRPASLADFATSGATLGYVWLDRTLLITTNAAAGEEAARRLGF